MIFIFTYSKFDLKTKRSIIQTIISIHAYWMSKKMLKGRGESSLSPLLTLKTAIGIDIRTEPLTSWTTRTFNTACQILEYFGHIMEGERGLEKIISIQGNA